MDHEDLQLVKLAGELRRWMVFEKKPPLLRVRVAKAKRAEFCAGLAPHCDRHGVHMQLIAQGVLLFFSLDAI